MKLSTKLLVPAFIAVSSIGFSNSVSISDSTFDFFNGATEVTTGAYDARWGTFSAGVFTPFLGVTSTENNLGYFDASGPEIAVTLSQGNNNVVSASSQLALALTLSDYASDYSNSAPQVIVTDPSWLAPTFVFLTDPQIAFNFSSNTTALRGSYSFNGGNDVLNVVSSVIPEPSSYAAIVGLGILGFAASRRRRVA
jgi:hypothetical protein